MEPGPMMSLHVELRPVVQMDMRSREIRLYHVELMEKLQDLNPTVRK